MTKSDLNPIKNVTARFDDVNPYDQIFEDEHGHLVKVRVVPRPALSDTAIVDITAAWADETGKARLFDDGRPFLITPIEHYVQPHSDVDVEAAIADLRLQIVQTAGRAIANYVALQAMPAPARQ